LDKIHTASFTLKEAIQLVGNVDIYLGGSPNTIVYTGSKVNVQFTGHIKKV